jgi:hypothetical protein
MEVGGQHDDEQGRLSVYRPLPMLEQWGNIFPVKNLTTFFLVETAVSEQKLTLFYEIPPLSV